MILVYRILWIILSPLWITWLAYRIFKGKEDFSRLCEKFGYGIKNGSKKGNVIWLHAASVGESRIALNLASKISIMYPNYQLLLTTGTLTSNRLVGVNKPSGAIHQFIPLDEYFSVKRFFNNWRPKLGIIFESEIWPNLISVAPQYCNIILANSIMSDKSYSRWIKFKKLAKHCFGNFSKILCQSAGDVKKFSMLLCEEENNINVLNLGNLKYCSPKLSYDSQEFNALKQSCFSRQIVFAASTHNGDEDIISQMHIAVKKHHPNLLTIIAPRHPIRAENIAQKIKSCGLTYSLRSKDEHISDKTDIYVADTLGELGLFFNIAKVTIIGGSFNNGGHNPIEPAAFKTHIIFGPDMRNFKDISNTFLEAKAATQIQNLQELCMTINELLETEVSINAQNVLVTHGKIMDNYLDILKQYIAL